MDEPPSLKANLGAAEAGCAVWPFVFCFFLVSVCLLIKPLKGVIYIYIMLFYYVLLLFCFICFYGSGRQIHFFFKSAWMEKG